MVLFRAILVSLSCLLLAACALGPSSIQPEVQAMTANPPGNAVLLSAQYYRFDPSMQASGQPAPERMQLMAQNALAQHGLQLDADKAQLGISASGSVNTWWYDGWGAPNYARRGGFTYGFGLSRGGWGFGLGGPLWDSPSRPVYISEAHIVMRDLQTGQIVFDSRARYESMSHDTDRILATLFQAALQDFPHASQGSQRLELPLLPRP